MAKLDINFVGFDGENELVLIQDKIVRLKKGKNRNNTYSGEVREGKCTLQIYKTHYYGDKNWLWWNILYFVVSIFGLFDFGHNKRMVTLNAVCEVEIMGDTNMTVRRQSFVDGGELVKVETDAQVDMKLNVQAYDKEAKKKQKKMRKYKIGILVGVAVIGLLLGIIL